MSTCVISSQPCSSTFLPSAGRGNEVEPVIGTHGAPAGALKLAPGRPGTGIPEIGLERLCRPECITALNRRGGQRRLHECHFPRPGPAPRWSSTSPSPRLGPSNQPHPTRLARPQARTARRPLVTAASWFRSCPGGRAAQRRRSLAVHLAPRTRTVDRELHDHLGNCLVSRSGYRRPPVRG